MEKIEKLTFKNVIMSIGVLPASYVDSMSYYETLLWLINYLENTVIPTVNNNGQAVEELQELYVQLKSYVDTYFDNLDVQEEINNKLDEMVEEGTLQEIIADYLNSKAIFGFDTKSDMLSASNLIDGSYARIYGFYSINDGGMGLYKIRKITNADVVDNMLISAMETDESLVAELIPANNTINILQIGAKNDNSLDTSALINKVINEYQYKLYIPKGTYKCDSTIEPTVNNTYITCDGTLSYIGNDTALKIKTKYNEIHIANINSNAKCVTLENTSTTESTCMQNRLYFGDLITSNDHCIYLYANNYGVCYNELSFKSAKAGETYYVIYVKTASGTAGARYINENIINGGVVTRGLYGLYIDSAGSPGTGESNGMKYNHISFEGVTNAIYIKGVRFNLIDVPRIAEITGKTITIDGQCDGNIFNINSLIKTHLIDLTNSATGDPWSNYINGEVSTPNGNRMGRDIITYNKKLQLRELLVNYTYKNFAGDSTEIALTDEDYANYFLIGNTHNPTITLNQYYGCKGISDLVIKPNENCPFTILDSYGNNVYNHDGTTTDRIHLICVRVSNTDTWYKL